MIVVIIIMIRMIDYVNIIIIKFMVVLSMMIYTDIRVGELFSV